MKKILPFVLLSLFLLMKENSFSQSATSTGNGNWTNPSVWSCACVPTSGYTIVINHDITLDTDFQCSSGYIIINASLLDDITGRGLWVNGTGFLTNNGTLDVKNFLYQGTGGPYMNHGTTTAIALMTTTVTYNSGILTVDSLTNTGTFTDSSSGTITADSVTNSGTFINNGTITFNQFTNTASFTNSNRLNFTDFTNNGTFNNADSLMGANSFWNTGIFNNNPNSYFQINNNFFNADLLLYDAVFTNQGVLLVQDSWYNMDTVKGTTGIFTVADTSYNSGWMKGSFEFCDLTPPPVAPFVDFNPGTISPNITWCVTGMKEIANVSFIDLFPNPAQYELTIQTTTNLVNAELTIYDPLGQVVKSISKINGKQITIDSKELSNGLYFMLLKNDNKQVTGKFIIDK
ncbi:MAG: T9SS type A sorting domain-containing protein [Bacteroidota bacterium]